MATLSLRQVANYKPVAQCSIEELAAEQIMAAPSGGVLFARKTVTTEKDAARGRILSLLTRQEFPSGLAILTMPGLSWRFENRLLRLREGHWEARKGPHRTYITAVENDRAIYHAAVTRMPGLHHGTSVTRILPPTPIAERVVRNRWIGRFFFANVDDLMEAQTVPFDAAWLDYTGPLSIKRLRVIADFYARNVRRLLIVTALKARWNRETSDAIERAGGHSAWVRAALPGKVMHDIEYQDDAPMAQIAIRKPSATK